MISLASNVTVIPAKKTIGTQKETDKKAENQSCCLLPGQYGQ